jgi:ATP adenylyltransferase/5',5'''-P-1,P-4-tetraphosphate phosphorylase II
MVKPLDVPAYESLQSVPALFDDLLPRAAAAALESFRTAAAPIVGAAINDAKVGRDVCYV